MKVGQEAVNLRISNVGSVQEADQVEKRELDADMSKVVDRGQWVAPTHGMSLISSLRMSALSCDRSVQSQHVHSYAMDLRCELSPRD